MNRTLSLTLPILLTFFSAESTFAQTQSSSLALTRVTVIDVVNGMALPVMTVVVTGNRITEVNKTGSAAIPEGAQVIEAAGKFVIPGLWDMHVHLGDATEAALPMLVASGVTGVRDMGSPRFETLSQWREEALAGVRIGPRIVAAGPILDGGSPDRNRLIVSNEAEARRAVKQLAEAGVDFIKVHEHLSRECYLAIADECKKRKLPFAGHVPVSDAGFVVSGKEASDAGQKCLEHLFGIPFPNDKSIPELLETLRRNGTWVDPTLTVYWNRLHFRQLADKPDDRMKFVAPSLKQLWEEQARGFSGDVKVPEMLLRFRMVGVKTLHDAGIPLLAGTDLGFPYVLPGDLPRELEHLVDAGIPPGQALCAATINAAKYLGREKELGTVEKDKLADLVVLDANPLEDIRATAQVNAVILNGRLFDRKTLDNLLAGVEAAVRK